MTQIRKAKAPTDPPPGTSDQLGGRGPNHGGASQAENADGDFIAGFPRGLGGGWIRTPQPHTPDFRVWLQTEWTLAEGVLLVHSVNPSSFADAAEVIRGPDPAAWPPRAEQGLRWIFEVAQRVGLPGADRVTTGDGQGSPSFLSESPDDAVSPNDMLLLTTTANSVLTVFDSALKAASGGTLRPDVAPAGRGARDAALWLFKPRTFLVWAVTRGGLAFDLPSELESFLHPDGQAQPKRRNPGRAAAWASDREQILGAAIAVMAAEPRCYEGGKWVAEQIVLAIEENSLRLWPEADEPPRSHEENRKLVSDWLHKLKRSTPSR